MYKSVLENLGWSAEEVDVYVTLLQLGTQPASVIARHLNKKRTTIRVYLEHLTEQGFVHFHWKERAQYFTAEKPEVALDSLEHKKMRLLQRVDKNIRAFAAILPELTALVREDINKRMYIDSLTSKTEILCLSSIEDLFDLFGKEYDSWYVKKRIKQKIPLRYIAKDTPIERKETKKDKKYLRQSRHIPAKLFDISNEINMYDGKVSIITLKNEKIGVLIQSQEIYHSMKVIFEVLWKSAPLIY
jgi:sugar-specific transcriptional regulator TrmB